MLENPLNNPDYVADMTFRERFVWEGNEDDDEE